VSAGICVFERIVINISIPIQRHRIPRLGDERIRLREMPDFGVVPSDPHVDQVNVTVLILSWKHGHIHTHPRIYEKWYCYLYTSMKNSWLKREIDKYFLFHKDLFIIH
jgi:hypothetical protein